MRYAKRITTGTLKAMLALPALGVGASSCGAAHPEPDGAAAYVYRVPEDIGDGWQTGSLGEVGMREAFLVRLMTDLHGIEGHELHSLLIVRHGKLVFEEYFPGRMFSLGRYLAESGFDRTDLHNLASVTKSFTTTLVGMAIDQGRIPSVQARVFDFFPEHADLVSQDPRRADMTIEHLLLMTSGIEWHDMEEYPYTDPRNDLVQMFNSDDPIRYALSRNLEAAPGTVFDYCNANTNILGEIVHRATGARLDRFGRNSLFDPLGVDTLEWQLMPDDVVFASGDLRLTPRDMAKFGEMILRMGQWNGRRIVSPAWIDAAFVRHISLSGPDADGYGYGWWQWDIASGGDRYRTYQAAGWGGQWIIVSRELDMVVVATGGNYFQEAPMPMREILADYVIPAVRRIFGGLP